METNSENTLDKLIAAQYSSCAGTKPKDSDRMETTPESTFDNLEVAPYSSGAGTKLDDYNTMICRMLVKIPCEKDGSPTLLRPRNVTNVSESTRKSWVDGMKRFVESETEYQRIRPLDFLCFLDGSVEVQSFDETCPDLIPSTYPSAYRIPPETITDLGPNEKVRRAELFALGSMIYEIYADEAPFEGLEDGDVQARYRRAQYPEVTHLPQWPMILSCWSVEFARELYAILSHLGAESKFKRFSRAAGNYISAHPVRFGIQCASTVVGIAAAVALPVLGAAGFGALGPVAGSSAAAWHASIGAVEAGSLFAWCQSAAMGGAAVNGIIAAGVTGGGVLLSSTAAGVLMDGHLDEGGEEKLMNLFRTVCRRSDGLEERSSGNDE